MNEDKNKPDYKDVGVLGGMFDPVHNGHICLAREVQKACALDAIKLLPCGVPVHKSSEVAASADRIAMLELVCEEVPGLVIDSRECEVSTPSYTFNTLGELALESKNERLFLIIGMDSFLNIQTWYRWTEILAGVSTIVAGRPGYPLNEKSLEPKLKTQVSKRKVDTLAEFKEHAKGKLYFLDVQAPDIASSEIRSRIRTGKDINALLPARVINYINKHNLYQN